MKESFRYFKLWQKKRNEMRVDDDPQADWLQMQSLLDGQMPEVKRSSGYKGLKILPTMFVAFSAAAMVYMISNIVSLEKYKRPVIHHQHHQVSFHPDTIIPDSLGVLDSSVNNVAVQAADSALLIHQAAPLQVNSRVTPNLGKPTLNGAIISNYHRGNVIQPPGNHIAGAATGQTRGPSSGVNTGRGAGLIHLSSGSSRHFAGNGYKAGRSISGRALNAGNKQVVQSNLSTSNYSTTVNDFMNPDIITRTGNHPAVRDNLLLMAAAPQLNFTAPDAIQPLTLPALQNGLRSSTLPGQTKIDKTKKDKAAKAGNTNSSKMDWGILTGVNSSGSFTPKSQNANFYSSSPVDLYVGLFASYKLNDTWAINPQVRLFSPQLISTTYNHANQSKVDSSQHLTITASRKVYAVSIPIYAVYNVTNNISFKAGPVINFPIKQINANSLLQPAGIKADSNYYTKIIGYIDSTQYDKKMNFGISAGASFKYKRFIFEAAYLKSLSGYGLKSGLGSYKSYNGTLQLTLGFQLDKIKP